MNRPLHSLGIGVVLVAVAGCASPPAKDPSEALTDPTLQFADVFFVNGPARELRERFAQTAAAAGLSVQPTAGEGHMMLVTYRGEPKNYIECGNVVSVVKSGKGERRYEFPAASASRRYELIIDRKTLVVDRRVSLEVALKIEFVPARAQRTRIAIEPSFRVTRRQSVQAKPSDFEIESSIGFIGTEGSPLPDSTAPCRSTGALEAELRSMLSDRG
jgi:hypothetical protein